MNAKTRQFGIFAVVAALGLATTAAHADMMSTNPGLENPFELSRSNANPPADALKEPVPPKSDIPKPGDGHLLADFVYYTSLRLYGGGVSLFGGGGSFTGAGFAGGGGSNTGGSPQFDNPEGENWDGSQTNPVPAPGAALLGMMGLSIVGRIRRRLA